MPGGARAKSHVFGEASQVLASLLRLWSKLTGGREGLRTASRVSLLSDRRMLCRGGPWGWQTSEAPIKSRR